MTKANLTRRSLFGAAALLALGACGRRPATLELPPAEEPAEPATAPDTTTDDTDQTTP